MRIMQSGGKNHFIHFISTHLMDPIQTEEAFSPRATILDTHRYIPM